MRRNNCWLAVLAVSTVLPILRHGLARERFPLDQEDTELKANRSKAAYGLDQTTPSVGTEEIDVASRNDATKLVLDASPLDQPPKKCTTIDDATKASQRNSEGGCIEDADPSARIHSVDQAIVQLDSKLASGFSLEDSRKRLAGAQTISEWTMLAGNSENSGERRLSTRISRGAVEHTSERTRAVIRADGTVRAATTSGRKRGTVDEETNRRGTRYGDRGASHYSHVGGSSRDDDSLTTPGERNFAGNRPLSGSESTDGRGRRGDGGSPGDGMTGYRSEIGDGEEFSMGGDGEVLSERGYGDRRRYEDFPSGTSEFDLEDRESEGLGERREVGGVRVWSLEEKSRKDRSVYDLMDGGVRSRDLGYDKKRGVKRSAVRKRESEVLHFWEESRNHSVDGKGSFEEMKGQEVEKGSVEFSSDYRENKVKSEAFNFLSTSVLPNSSSEEGSRLGESKFEEQEVDKGSVELKDYREKVKSEAFNFLSTSVLPNSSSEEGSRLGESKFEEQEVDKGSVELKDYREKVKSEAFNFLSTSVLPSLEGGNEVMESKLDHEEQKLSRNSIDLNSSNGDYEKNQIKFATLNYLSTSTPPSSSLEGANKLVESKLDQQEEKLSEKSIDLNSSNEDYQQNQIQSETLNYLSTSIPPGSSLEGADKLVESKLDHQEQKLPKKSIDLNSSNGNYQQNPIKFETLNFLSTLTTPNSNLEGGNKLLKSKFDHQEQKLSKSSIDLNSSNDIYQKNQMKSETLNFQSTLMTPSSSLEGSNKLVESKLDNQEQKLSEKSIDLNSANGNYQKNQIKFETLNFLSTLTTPNSNLEGANKLEESKLDHQEQKLSEKSIDLSSSNDNYQQNQMKSETLNVQSTFMPPSSSLEGAHILAKSKLDHQKQKLPKNSIDPNSSNNNQPQNQIKSEKLNFLSTSAPSLTPAKLADLTPNKLSKRSLDPTSDRLKTPPKPELSPVRFDPSPDRIHPLASSSQESSRERYNSAGIENPERVPTSRKSAEVYKDGSLELRDVSPEQRSTTNNDVPEDNEPASSNRVAFPVSRTAIDVSAVERERGNLHTTNKDEVTLAEEPGKLTNGNGYSYLGENRSVDVVNNGTTHFHFSGDSDANDMSKMENVGSREDRGSPRVEIRDGKEDWRKDVSNDGADFNFPEINVAGNLSERDNLRLNTRSDDNRGVVEEGSRYSVDQDGGKVWKGGKVTLMERSREEMSNSGADFNFPEINVAGNLSERDNLRLNTRSDDNRGVVEEGSRYSVDQDGGKVWKEGKVTLMERSKENVSNSGADFNFSEINAGKLSKMDNLTLIEDKVTLMEESTKLANANGNSPEKPLSSMHHSPRGIGTFDRKNSVSAENPAEGSETPSPMDPVAINSKENQRSPNKNNHSSVNSLNSTHHSFPITGTFDRKISNPSGEDPEDSNSRKNHESPNKNNNSSVNILNSTHSSFPITGTFDRKASDRTNPIISAQKPLKDLNSKEDQRSPNKNNDSSVNILNSTHSSFSITGISDRKTNNPSISAENPEDSNSKEDQRSPNKTNNSSVNILNFTHHSFPIIGTSDRKTSDRKNPSINAQKPPEDSNSKENHQSPNKPNNSSVNPLNSMHPTVPTTDTSTTKSKNSTISSQTPITTQDLLEDSKAPDDSLVVKSRGSQRSSIESHGLWIPSTPFNLGENDDGIEAPEPEAGVADQTLSATGQRSISLTGTSGAVVENHEERGTTSRVSLKLNGPVANDPVIVVKDAASSRDSSNQNSQLSAHGIKDNEPAVGFTSGERVRDVAGNGRGAETIDEVNLDGSWNGDHAGISKSFVESMEQRDSRGNLGNSGAKLGSSMGKLGNSRLGNSFVIGAGNVEKERAEESSWSSLKTGLSGVTGILGNKAKGDTRDPMEGSIGSIEEFLSTKEDETVGGVRVKGFQFSEQEDKMTEGVAVVKDGIKNSMNGETKSSGNSKEMRVENLQSAKLEDQRTQVDLTAVVKDSLKDPMNRKSKSSKEMRVENTESVKQEVQRVEVDLDALLEDSIRDPMDTESESFKSSKKMRAGNLQSVKQEDQMAEVDLTAVVKDSFKDPMNRKSKSSKEMMVENLQSAKQKDQRTQVGLAEIVEDSNHEPINRESKSSKSSKEMRVENPRSVKQEVQRVEVDLDALLEDSIKDPMDTESKSSKSLKKMRVENLQSAKQEDQRTQVGLAEIVEDSNHEPINRESKSSKSSKKMRVENLQSAKQEDQRTQVDLTAVVEDSLKDPMDTESKSSRSSKKMRVEILQSAKQEDQRTQISPTEIVEDREFKSSIEESLDLKKNGTLVKPRAKDLTKQPINTTLHLSSALNKTLNNLMNQSTSSTNDLPSPKGNTSLTSKVSQHKFETQPNPPSTKPNNIDNPQIQSSVLPNNLHSPEQRPSDSPTKQRRDSSGFPTKSEVPSSVLGDKAPNVTSTKIESSPFENLGPGSSVLDRREFIAQSRATITSTMDETTSPRTASFGEDVPFETTESGRMDAGASIASTTDMDRLVYLGTGEDRITTAANVSQGGGDNSSHELEYQWPVKHSAVVEGDLVLGGLMMVHEREDRMTCGPVMPQGGVQAVEAMLYTLDWLNEQDIVPGVKIGAHILDDCDKDTYGLEMAVDFIKGPQRLPLANERNLLLEQIRSMPPTRARTLASNATESTQLTQPDPEEGPSGPSGPSGPNPTTINKSIPSNVPLPPLSPSRRS